MAIEALHKWTKAQSPKQIVLMAKKYNIITWLKAAYTQFILQVNPFDELTRPPRVDWETIARLFYIKILGTSSSASVDYLVGEIFKAEFETMAETWINDPPPPIAATDGELFITQLRLL